MLSHCFILVALVFSVACASGCNDRGVAPINGEPGSTIIPCEGPIGEWQFLGLNEETVTAIAVDPNDPKVIYIGTLYDFSAGRAGKLFKSTNCGGQWDTLLVGGGYTDILIDPNHPNVIYALPGTIIRSTDNGASWQEIREGIQIDPDTRVASIAIDPTNSDILYAGTGGFFGGTLYKTYNAGQSWAKIWPDSLQDGAISIAIDPTDANTLYVGTAWAGLLVRSTDGGTTWNQTGLAGCGLVHDILVDAGESSYLLVGCSDGISMSQDSGVTWSPLNNGILSGSRVIKIQRSSSMSTTFIVATTGDDGWVYRSSQVGPWTKLGIDTLRESYYYSDLLLNETTLYFGARGGLFRMQLF